MEVGGQRRTGGMRESNREEYVDQYIMRNVTLTAISMKQIVILRMSRSFFLERHQPSFGGFHVANI